MIFLLGKRSYTLEKLYENYKALITAINSKRPPLLKTKFVHKASVSTDHGPSCRINPGYVNKNEKNYEFK